MFARPARTARTSTPISRMMSMPWFSANTTPSCAARNRCACVWRLNDRFRIDAPGSRFDQRPLGAVPERQHDDAVRADRRRPASSFIAS